MPTTLGNHISTLKGFAFKSKWYCAAGTPIVRVSDFSDDAVDTASLTYIPEEMAIEYERYRLTTGDVVIQTVGSWPNNPQSVVGKAIRVPSEASGALLNQNAVRIDPTEDLDKTFLFYLLRNNLFKNYIVGCAQGAASQASITLEAIRNFSFELPPLPIQRKIADVLSAYDDLIEINSRRIRVLEAMAQSVYREWFGNVDAKSLPKGWEMKSLGDFGKVVTGKTPSKEIDDYWNSRDVPFIRTPDMHNQFFCVEITDYVSEKGALSQKNKFIPPNSLLMNCIGANAGSVTITSIISQTNQQINSIVLHDLSDLEFLYFALSDLRDTVRLYGSTGATMINLSMGKFLELQVLTPAKELRTEYHDIASPMFEHIKNLQQKNAYLRRTRELLLPRLVSGEVGVEGL